MPKFPEIDRELTCEYALNMVLVSFAMEELALSHIINAEGEKLQYVIGKYEKRYGNDHCIDEILSVNQSVNAMLESIAQHETILKNKIDKTLQALTQIHHADNLCKRCRNYPCKRGEDFRC